MSSFGGMEMDVDGSKRRFTSPTRVVRAFAQAMKELETEGGKAASNALSQYPSSTR